jgi:hypothetical protein
MDPFGRQRTGTKQLRKAQFGQQDKCIGLAELIDAIETDQAHFHSCRSDAFPQADPRDSGRRRGWAKSSMKASFAPIALPSRTAQVAPDYKNWTKASRSSTRHTLFCRNYAPMDN